MIVNTDIDIDVADRDKLLKLIKGTTAMILRDNKQLKHNTGVYFHDMPSNPYTGLASVDYKEAEEMGYFKIDVLNVGLYKDIKSKEHLHELLAMEPMWELLEHQEVVEKCFHIHKHFDIVKTLKPKSVEQLAAVLAIIRPAKRHLLKQGWDEINDNVWKRPAGDEYFFKKAHAHAYALAIVLQLNMMATGLSLQD
tara:strand:- start:206 stop:790 length:585 start_codon:yes stop_codon:yes gene_type:complete